ncbi:hypothetical protein KC980_01570 [candidate division WWE3 bacterium]|uniref:Uncharacterized protein n=1 Tax=candidate division WWE3 bacterium TaxID=2053526 RepID=A0A955J1U3_UNCKA|nr:hypothetical protein [candidate division WWE3 bacterium]
MISFDSMEQLNKFLEEQGVKELDSEVFTKENLEKVAKNTLEDMEGDTRISLKIKKSLLNEYKEQAETVGVPYYSLINMTLYNNSPRKIITKTGN